MNHTPDEMNPERLCFCELAPLYALEVLAEPERRWLEEQVAASPDLAGELADYQTVVAALAYGTPEISPASDLKDRLFQRLGCSPPHPTAVSPTSASSRLVEQVLRSQDQVWQAHPVPGITIAILYLNQARREVTALLRAAAGVRYPLHRHAGVEEIYMLEGDLVVGDESYGPGDYLRSLPNSVHAPETRGGCMFLVKTSLDDEILVTTAV